MDGEAMPRIVFKQKSQLHGLELDEFWKLLIICEQYLAILWVASV